MSRIIAVDFDGTLCLSNFPNEGPENEPLCNKIRECIEKGDRIILNTCREGEDLRRAIIWCASHNIKLSAANKNLPEMVRAYGHKSRKVFADIYLDDKAVSFSDFYLM